MTDYTTKTREFDRIEFSLIGSYVYADINGQRKQICYGGDFTGSTVQLSRFADQDTLKAAAQAWMRQRREWQRKEGM